MALDKQRVLLLGGPFDFRTTWVRPDMYDLLIPIPTERSLLADYVDYADCSPMNVDFKVARYYRSGELASHGRIAGWIFEYGETR